MELLPRRVWATVRDHGRLGGQKTPHRRLVRSFLLHALAEEIADETGDARVVPGRPDSSPLCDFLIDRDCHILHDTRIV